MVVGRIEEETVEGLELVGWKNGTRLFGGEMVRVEIITGASGCHTGS